MAQDSENQGSGSAATTRSRENQPSQEGQRIPQSRSSSEIPSPMEDTEQGRTTIAASVVQKIAGLAARDISGVHSMGGGVSRAFGALRERIPGGSGTQSTSGVQVEVGERQAAVDLDIVVEYGVSIVDLSRSVRRNVITGVERMTGLDVIEVNISVNDIQLPDDDSDQAAGNGGQQSGSRVE